MLNIAIVGTGNISRLHLLGYQEFPERCRIVALCDIVPERAAAFIREGIGIREGISRG